LEVKGEKFVEGIVYKDKNTGKITELKVSGIFVEVGQIPNTSFAKDIVPLDEIGRIKIDAWTQKTETKGIWRPEIAPMFYITKTTLPPATLSARWKIFIFTSTQNKALNKNSPLKGCFFIYRKRKDSSCK